MELPTTEAALPVGSVPTVSAPPALDFDDEDDDLPRPGKVWDNSGPSLKELLAQQMAKTETPVLHETPAPAADAFANVEPVGNQDLGTLWKNLLDLMMTHGPMFNSLIANGNLARIDGDQAVITYTKKNDMLRKMLERNPKRDSVREGLTQILGKPMGVRFEVDESVEEETAPVRPAVSASSAPAQAARPAAPARPAPPPEPAGPPAIRITPELIEQMKQDPLAGSIIETFNATPVKVE